MAKSTLILAIVGIFWHFLQLFNCLYINRLFVKFVLTLKISPPFFLKNGVKNGVLILLQFLVLNTIGRVGLGEDVEGLDTQLRIGMGV